MKNIHIILLIIFCILIGIYAILKLYINNSNNNNSNNKYAIVVLTRGYDSNEQYKDLINRNKSIYNIYYEKLESKNNYSIIIFNEGNITPEQQIYIQSNTPYLPLIFKTIIFYQNTNTNKDLCPPTDLSNSFSIGYKNMCYFWSIDFIDYLQDYEYIIRIDEDCIIHKLDINILDTYKTNNIMFSSPSYQSNDSSEVIVGIDTLFNQYLKTHNLIQKNKLNMPYTNFMICNIQFFKNNKDVINILEEIKISNCIFSNRWGDLPIWGYILSYLIDSSYYIEDKSISYFHGSHAIKINN